MTFGFLFWLVFLLCLIFSTYWHWPQAGAPNYGPIGSNFMVFVMLFLLGWKVFGFMIQG